MIFNYYLAIKTRSSLLSHTHAVLVLYLMKGLPNNILCELCISQTVTVSFCEDSLYCVTFGGNKIIFGEGTMLHVDASKSLIMISYFILLFVFRGQHSIDRIDMKVQFLYW